MKGNVSAEIVSGGQKTACGSEGALRHRRLREISPVGLKSVAHRAIAGRNLRKFELGGVHVKLGEDFAANVLLIRYSGSLRDDAAE